MYGEQFFFMLCIRAQQHTEKKSYEEIFTYLYCGSEKETSEMKWGEKQQS
jgi:hypothetical protein